MNAARCGADHRLLWSANPPSDLGQALPPANPPSDVGQTLPPVPPPSDVGQAVSPANPRSLLAPFRLLLRLLRELADENAYARHLATHGVPHSAAEWRRFSQDRLAAKFARAKCC